MRDDANIPAASPACFPASAHRPTGGEKIFTVLVLIYSTGAFLPILQGSRDPDAGPWMGTLLTNVLWLSIYGTALYFLLQRHNSSFREVKWNWLLLMLVGIAPLSLLWSDDRLLTFLRSGALCGTALISLYIRRSFSPRQMLSLCAWALAIAGVCSAFFAIFLPQYGIGTGDFKGEWLGVYGQKNAFAAAMAIGFLVALLLSTFTPGRRIRYFLLGGFMVVLVYLADSTTSLLICLALSPILWATRAVLLPSRHFTRRRILAGILVIASLLILTLNFQQITNAMGKDETLTGRTALWLLVIDAIVQRPILGYGYEAFWRGYEGPAGEVWTKFGQFLFYSHNGFLEVWLGLGVLGIIVVVTAIAVVGWNGLKDIRRQYSLENVWPWLFLCYFVLSNLTEASFMKSNTLPMILFFTIVLRLPTGFGRNAARRPR